MQVVAKRDVWGVSSSIWVSCRDSLTSTPPPPATWTFALAWLGYEDEWDYFRELLAAADERRRHRHAEEHDGTQRDHDRDRPAFVRAVLAESNGDHRG